MAVDNGQLKCVETGCLDIPCSTFCQRNLHGCGLCIWAVQRQVATTDPALQHSTKDTAPAASTQLCRDRLLQQTLLFNILLRILPQLHLLSCAETGCCDRPCSSLFYQGYCPSGSEKQLLPKHLCACTGCGFNMHRFFMQWFTVQLFFDGELSVRARVHLPCILPAMLVQSCMCIQQDSSGMDVTVTW